MCIALMHDCLRYGLVGGCSAAVGCSLYFNILMRGRTIPGHITPCFRMRLDARLISSQVAYKSWIILVQMKLTSLLRSMTPHEHPPILGQQFPLLPPHSEVIPDLTRGKRPDDIRHLVLQLFRLKCPLPALLTETKHQVHGIHLV